MPFDIVNASPKRTLQSAWSHSGAAGVEGYTGTITTLPLCREITPTFPSGGAIGKAETTFRSLRHDAGPLLKQVVASASPRPGYLRRAAGSRGHVLT